MLDRRTSAILFHATGDSLMGISNHSANPFEIEWTTRTRLTYQLLKSTSLADDWNPAVAWTLGTGLVQQHLAPQENRAFFKVAYQPQEAPVDEPVNDGFFLGYDDFGL